ncbi:uncharacterized protein N7503_008234 [Penicillium pulvis]|uniref:uncharacterized protein n=1 Tax=Penicillium pulvis TaxID=1562058 RepID=UPI002547FEF2|nr:uncharacterized protein N7503_008234 [Penicillium pulvis]KAJ5792256.1 hypothetical protein N7503_008234 [Penicillium pulvis]
MRINIAALALASSLTTGMATPALDRRKYTGDMSLPEENGLAIEQTPPTCNGVACIGLTGTLTCVLSAISGGDTTALQHCLSGGLSEICSCAACIPQVNNFLQALGICVTGLDMDNITASSLSLLFTALSEMKTTAITTTKFDASQIVPVSSTSN